MSEQNNAQIVQQLYAAFARGDIQAALDTFSDAVAKGARQAWFPSGGERS